MSRDFQFLIYKSAEEDVSVNAFIQDETIWINANQMAVLVGKRETTIQKHINNVVGCGKSIARVKKSLLGSRFSVMK